MLNVIKVIHNRKILQTSKKAHSYDEKDDKVHYKRDMVKLPKNAKKEDCDVSSTRIKRKRYDENSDSEGYVSDESNKTLSRQHETKQESLPTQTNENSAPDAKGAWLCASILVLLNQSKCYENVSNAMIWPCDTADFLANDEPHDCLIFASLLCSYTSCDGNSGASETDDNGGVRLVFSLCTQAILKGRSDAHDESPFHLFGFQVCEKLMLKRSQSGWLNAIDDQECIDILSVLHPEDSKSLEKEEIREARRSLKSRPHLRSSQIQAATECFLSGDHNFHQKFDTIYATTFVVLSLRNESLLVRHAGISAVAAALKLLPFQGKIVEDASKSLVPLPSFVDDNHTNFTFSKWARSQSETSCSSEKRIWKEIRLSLESDAISCLSVIGGTTSETGIFNRILFDLIYCSFIRSELLGLCFRSLERIANLRSFVDLEHMLRVKQEWLLQKWISSGRELLSMPMILCSPSLVRNIMRLNCAWDLMPMYSLEIASDGDRSGLEILDVNKLHCEICCDYISQTACSLIPLILISHSEENIEPTKEDSDKSNKRWQYLVEASNALVCGCTDDHISNILRSHLHDIYSFVFPMLQSNRCIDNPILTQARGNNIVQFLRRVLPEETIKKQAARKVHLVIRLLLKLSV